MSLETIQKKLLTVNKLSPWKILLFFGLTPSVWFLIFYSFFKPEIAQASVALKLIFVMGFAGVFLLIFFMTVISCLVIVYYLRKLNNNVLENSGKFVGKSLSTNHEFLRNLARNLHSYLREFRQEDFALQIDEIKKGLENKIEKLQKENTILNSRIGIQDTVIARQNQDIFRLKWNEMTLKRDVDSLKSDKKEHDQIASEKIHVQNQSDDDTKS